MSQAVLRKNNNLLYLCALALSLCISFWLDYRQSVINPDAICYLLSAETLASSGLQAAMHLCGQAKWPFYSMLIYGFVKLTHFSYTTAAYTLNALFSAFSVYLFIRILKIVGANRKVLWLGAGVILLWHEFNTVREYIVRDHGFWAAYLLSLFCLLRYFRQPNGLNAFSWGGALLLATLFRIEGAIFLLVLPNVAWFMRDIPLKSRAQHFLRLSLPLLIISFVLGAWLLLHPAQSLENWGRVQEVTTQLQHGLVAMADRYHHTRNALVQYVLNADSAKEAGLIFILVLFAWYLMSVIKNVTVGYALLVSVAWFKRLNPFQAKEAVVIYAYLLVNVLITFVFLVERFFLSKRYLIALSLILLLWVPFALQYCWQQREKWSYRFTLMLATILMIISAVGGIVEFGYSKTYIRDAGNWLAEHVPTQASLYVNDQQLMYYSEHFKKTMYDRPQEYFHLKTIAHQQWKHYDYLALRLNQHDAGELDAIVSELNLKPIQVFQNTRGDRVEIYKT